jgi:transcription-repair coupling factor (superfamily II helicase)
MTLISKDNPIKQSYKKGFRHYYKMPLGSAFALNIAKKAQEKACLHWVLLPESKNIRSLRQEIRFFLGEKTNIPIFILPDWETLPYDPFSPHSDIISERLKTLSLLAQHPHAILLLPIHSALQYLPPPSFIATHCITLTIGQSLDIKTFTSDLITNGYYAVNSVMEHGEYAVRGGMIDLYPMGSSLPIRIELFDSTIDSLRYFETENQLTIKKVDSIQLLPAKEYATSNEAIACFRKKWRTHFEHSSKNVSLYREVSQGIFPAGMEYYLPLFFEKTVSIFEYLNPETTVLLFPPDAEKMMETFLNELKLRYEQYRYDINRPILPPQHLFLTHDFFNQTIKSYVQIHFLTPEHKYYSSASISISSEHCMLPSLVVDYKKQSPFILLNEFVDQKPNTKIVICTESKGRQEIIDELLLTHQIKAKRLASWDALSSISSKLNYSFYLMLAPLQKGFSIENILILAESDLFGQHILPEVHQKNSPLSPNQRIHSLAKLKIDDPVVHIAQGVGRYKGLKSLQSDGITTEFFVLEYRDEGILYVPIQSLNAIHRFSSVQTDNAPWHKLGTDTWSKAKQKAQEKARDSAAELLDIYAKRASKMGVQHQIHSLDYAQFSQEFPFPLTHDQSNAIDDVLNDMRSKHPMDRLICGDVGFGKTEVAMRAAFVSLQSEMQVAILVPTTLLAQQHFNSFQERFSQWPINVAVLSRFQTPKEQKTIIHQLALGNIDLLVGTHRLISGKLQFKNLGLLIIDEEHRFGVRQKEQLKAYRANVDILTLTATPIPRTLNMSISGMRDLSMIMTPPAKRLSIKTFVHPYAISLIKEAVQREISRGGQIFFVHNSVKTIEQTAQELSSLFPKIKVAVTHGQMPERELETIMNGFCHQRFHLLVCTTIIETGIDIPNANTIIIHRADKLGLAQLHQLRGRVGRSHHQAYAYLLTPPKKQMTSDAIKRLDAIGKLNDLGAGFVLATHDLEIRGAGEFLGDEQTGHMQNIGFDLYMDLLNRAISHLKLGNDRTLHDIESEQIDIHLGKSALLPDSYIHDVSVRLSFYKRMANAQNKSDLHSLKIELIDRFGLLPTAVNMLFKVSEWRLQLTPLGILKLYVEDDFWRLDFSSTPTINTSSFIRLIQSNPKRYQLLQGTQLKVIQTAKNIDEREKQIQSLIHQITASH